MPNFLITLFLLVINRIVDPEIIRIVKETNKIKIDSENRSIASEDL